MQPPRFPAGHPDRFVDLQEMVEPAVAAVITSGTDAGWTTAELAAAIIEVADNLMLADAENRRTNEEIAAFMKRRRGE